MPFHNILIASPTEFAGYSLNPLFKEYFNRIRGTEFDSLVHQGNGHITGWERKS